jgi:predicted Zn-dependent peptidase
MPDVRSVSVGFWVDAGSRDEPAAQAGASHFLEHLLFKGTPRRTAQQIAEAIDAVGGDMNAFTTKEYTAFYVRVLDDDLDVALDILSDIMWDPAFRPDEIEAERQVILEEILMHEDEPADLVHDVFAEALFTGHPLGREVLGDASTIRAMTRDDIAGYFGRFYHPANIVVALAGNIDHDAAVDGIERRYAGRGGEAVPERGAPGDAQRPVAVVHRPTEQAHVVVGMRAIDRDDEDRFAFSVLNHALGGGMSSRLFQEIREQRGLAYSVYSYRMGFAGGGALAAYVGTSPDNAKEVLSLVHGEFDRIAGDGITDRELEVAKGHLNGSMALSLEDSSSRMSRLGRSQLVHGEVMSIDDTVAAVDSVTRDDLARVSARVLANERTTAVVGPFDADQLGLA